MIMIDRDGASQVETITGLELFRVDLDSREPVKVKDSWSDKSSLRHSFNFKEKVVNPESNSAYFYKYVFIITHDHDTRTYCILLGSLVPPRTTTNATFSPIPSTWMLNHLNKCHRLYPLDIRVFLIKSFPCFMIIVQICRYTTTTRSLFYAHYNTT